MDLVHTLKGTENYSFNRLLGYWTADISYLDYLVSF